MDAIKCGNFIANRRKELNMTQKELADKLNVTDKAVSRWERGLGLPDINSLEDLSIALNVTIYELIKSEKTNEKSEEIDNSIKEVVTLANNQNDLYKKNIYNKIIVGIIVFAAVISLVWGINAGFAWNWAIFGLIAYVIAIINLIRVIFISNKYCSTLVFISMSFATLTLLSEYKLVNNWVINGDFSALEDVVPANFIFLIIALLIGCVINLITVIISEVKYRHSI